MIELRWVVGYEPAPEFGPDTLKAVKVLQYRQMVVKGAWAFEPPADAFKEWSQWITVPTVTAEEAEK